MSKRNPDHEMNVMQRGLRDLAVLPPAGRRRVLAYWCARAEALPEVGNGQHGAQQLDIEDAPMMPHLKGAAA
jgi:hypothetical protein